MKLVPLIFAAGGLFLSGCASDVANRYYSSEHYPPRPVADVQILIAQPSRPFDVIADFQSRNESPEDLREKAAKIGADAVIVSKIGGAYDYREEWADQNRWSDTYDHIVGTAIKYR